MDVKEANQWLVTLFYPTKLKETPATTPSRPAGEEEAPGRTKLTEQAASSSMNWRQSALSMHTNTQRW